MADTEALFVEYREGLFRYLCRAVGHDDTARDLTQDVFVRVSRTSVPVGPDIQLRAWLFKIARNLALDHHRRRARVLETTALETAERGHTPRPDIRIAVNDALQELADLDRDVFLLKEAAGLSYDEIASACDLTPDAVRSRIHRARLQLRDRLSASIQERRTRPLRQAGTTRRITR